MNLKSAYLDSAPLNFSMELSESIKKRIKLKGRLFLMPIKNYLRNSLIKIRISTPKLLIIIS